MEKKHQSPGWIRVDYSYRRENGDIGQSQGVIASNADTSFENVKREVKQWVAGWIGKGEITINWLETGPFKNNWLTDKQQAFFEDKKYKFDESDRKYRWENGHLYELAVSGKCYIHCFHNAKVKTKKKAIVAYEEAAMDDFDRVSTLGEPEPEEQKYDECGNYWETYNG